jgi:hypothetical protein
VLHPLDLKDPFDEGLRCERSIHGRSIDIHLYKAIKNGANHESEEICPTHMHQVRCVSGFLPDDSTLDSSEL